MKKSKEEIVKELAEKAKKYLNACNTEDSLFNFCKFTHVFKKLKKRDASYKVISIKTDAGTKLDLTNV